MCDFGAFTTQGLLKITYFVLQLDMALTNGTMAVQYYRLPRHILAMFHRCIASSSFKKQDAKFGGDETSSRTSLQQLRRNWGLGSFGVSKMSDLIDHDNHDQRQQMRKLLSQPLFTPRYNVTLDAERELALTRLKEICDKKHISVVDFRGDPRRIFTAHELTAVVDPSTACKMTVQFNLFGGTILRLGSETHHQQLLAGIDTLEDIGCFALTELGYGNNAVEMETTATYDRKTEEFVVSSPTTLAQK